MVSGMCAKPWMTQSLSSSPYKDLLILADPHRSGVQGKESPCPFLRSSPPGTLFQALVPLPTARDDASKQLILGSPSALGYTPALISGLTCDELHTSVNTTELTPVASTVV